VEHLWLFAVLVLGIVALPGMDMAYVMGSALTGGRAAGLAALAGVVTGGMAHVAMGSLGLGLVLQQAPLVFNLVLLAGGLYVAWMGLSLLRSSGAVTAFDAAPQRSLWRGFAGAALTCLLNPKAYVFMVAVFPQFYRADAGSLLRQALVMGLIIACIQTLVYGLAALAAAGIRERLAHSASAQTGLARTVGVLLLATAAWTLWTAWRGV
jgi:threonine/homoserine/homoserine lactone efflux protein